MSLNQIDAYQYDGERTLLLGQTTDSGGGGVTESLASEIKNVGGISFFYRIVNCCMYAQSKALQQSVEQVYVAGGLGEVSFMQLLHIFWSTQDSLGEYFKEIWVRVKPNSPMPFMSDITNE